jgi:hypothetical protein
MLALLAMVCGVILLLYLPYEGRKVRGGWVRRRYTGPLDEFPAVYCRQLTAIMWMGVAIAAINVALAPLDTHRSEWLFKLLIAAIWLGAAGVALLQRNLTVRPAA